MAGQLQGKVAILVGATSGMGRATALRFAREGASVALAGRRAGLLQELGEQIVEETGTVALGVPCDVQDREQVSGLVSVTLAQFGRVDILVYATGTNIPDRSLERLTPNTWERMVGTNLTGAYHCTQLVLPAMRQQGEGLLIYLSTGAVKRADASGIAYQASKGGLDGIAGGTMAEEKGNGIRTSVIYPGLCDTPLVLKRPVPTPPEVMQHALQPEDVAEACLFVAALPPRCHVPELVLLPSRL
jgi:NAD(P)-dependent dehydrogenase (short-subunit alcohol dehydrogenase family)